MAHSFGTSKAKAHRAEKANHAKELVMGAKDFVSIPASRTAKGKPVITKGISKPFNGGK